MLWKVFRVFKNFAGLKRTAAVAISLYLKHRKTGSLPPVSSFFFNHFRCKSYFLVRMPPPSIVVLANWSSGGSPCWRHHYLERSSYPPGGSFVVAS
jgi:hypothetical protein